MKPQPATQTAAVKECRALYNKMEQQLEALKALQNLTQLNLQNAREAQEKARCTLIDTTDAKVDAESYADAARWCLLIATILHAVALALYFTK